MLLRALLATTASTSVLAAAFLPPDQIKNLITFGDSYTDEGRLAAILANKGKSLPPGTYVPISNATASGGYSWPYYASELLGATLYNYALSGATCSNEIISRYLSAIDAPYPSLIDDGVPAFQADVNFSSLYTDRTSDNTVYTIWIGTNDLGFEGFLTDSQRPGTSITNYVECIWESIDKMYEVGARYFVVFNLAPLQLTPMYASLHSGGAGNSNSWPNKTSYNTTEAEYKIWEYTTMVNTMLDYGIPFQFFVQNRWAHASFSIFNVHQLITDIFNDGSKYLDAPANVINPYKSCPAGETCTESKNSLSSFLWYDELHPSTKTDEVIGNEFIRILAGNSTYGTYYMDRPTTQQEM